MAEPYSPNDWNRRMERRSALIYIVLSIPVLIFLLIPMPGVDLAKDLGVGQLIGVILSLLISGLMILWFIHMALLPIYVASMKRSSEAVEDYLGLIQEQLTRIADQQQRILDMVEVDDDREGPADGDRPV